jgi:uncharacterized protein YeaO (DUF488 family)
MTSSLTETYAAAIQHDLVDLEGATPVGVVRRPPGWFHAQVEENHRELGPPGDLLDETKERQADLQQAGMGETAAHNAAFEETDFAERYRTYLGDDPDARAALEALADRVRAGEDVALVCFEADDKACHRHTLLEVLREGL